MGGTISAASRDASKRCHVLVPGTSATQEESAPRPSGLPWAVAGFPPLRSMSPGRRVAYGDRVDTCTGVGVERRGYYLGSIMRTASLADARRIQIGLIRILSLVTCL